MIEMPSRTISAEERLAILSRCPSLQEPIQPTPQLLAVIEHWKRQQLRYKRKRRAKEDQA